MKYSVPKINHINNNDHSPTTLACSIGSIARGGKIYATTQCDNGAATGPSECKTVGAAIIYGHRDLCDNGGGDTANYIEPGFGSACDTGTIYSAGASSCFVGTGP